jgi:hypothetical protein
VVTRNPVPQQTSEEMRLAHQAWLDGQVTTSSCFFCRWKFKGTALEGREAALEHRREKHPEALIRKPRIRGSRIKKRGNRTAGEEAQIAVDTAEARRVRHEREMDDALAKVERGRQRAALSALDGAA